MSSGRRPDARVVVFEAPCHSTRFGDANRPIGQADPTRTHKVVTAQSEGLADAWRVPNKVMDAYTEPHPFPESQHTHSA